MTTLVSDTFTRTSTTSPGTADTGQAWTVHSGTWGTDGANLHSVSMTDNTFVSIETGSTTQHIEAVLTAGAGNASAFPELLACFTSVSDHYWFEVDGGNGQVRIMHYSSFTSIASSATGVMSNGATLKGVAVRNGNGTTTLTAYVNGTQVCTGTDTSTTRARGTRVGFRHGASAAGVPIKWGSLLVTDNGTATGSPNAAPTVNAGPDQANVEPWSAVTLTGTDSDSDGTIASRTWTQTAGSPTVTLAGTGATRTFEAPATVPGTTLTFQYAATDDDGASTTDTMTVAVLPAAAWIMIGGSWVPCRWRTT